MKEIVALLKETFTEWQEDKVPRLSAALAYYTMLSIAPLLLIVVSIAGFVWSQDDVTTAVSGQIQELVGEGGANLLQEAIDQAAEPRAGIIATVIGLATLLFGATGVFAQLQDAMNTIWGVQPRPDLGIKGTVKKRITALTMVLGIAFLLLVSLAISATLSAVNTYMSDTLPGGAMLWTVVNTVISLGVITLLFAMIFKYLPDVQIGWQSVWLGAFVTAILFTIGKFLLGEYIGSSSIGAVYGAAGSLAVILVWIYYSGLILFFGAEFTQVYARRYGKRIAPDKDAVALTPEMRARQGIPHKEQVEQAQSDQEELAALFADPKALEEYRAAKTRTSKIASDERAAPVLGFLAGLLFGSKRTSKKK